MKNSAESSQPFRAKTPSKWEITEERRQIKTLQGSKQTVP